MKKVAILGCGPAGLLVAHAANINGCDFQIFSRPNKSRLFGCQYLHAPVTGVTGLPERVSYSLVGSVEGYRRKVYGSAAVAEVSPESLMKDHDAYDIRQAYDELWRRYACQIQDFEFMPGLGSLILGAGKKNPNLDQYDMVISTIPRKVWRQPGDEFTSIKVWAIGDAPELGQLAPFCPDKDFTVMCNGTSDVGWYRLSRVFGFTTIEWPERCKPPIPGAVLVEKPLDCMTKGAPGFYHLGRYGEWRKGVLTTDAFYQALELTK